VPVEASDSEEEWEPVQERVITMEEDEEPVVPVPQKTFGPEIDPPDDNEDFDEAGFKELLDLEESDVEEELEGEPDPGDGHAQVEDPTDDLFDQDDEDFSSSEDDED
jgi:hypothetical protein